MVLIAEENCILKAGLEFLLDFKPREEGNKHQIYILSNDVDST